MITFIFQESVPVPEIKENGDMIILLVTVLFVQIYVIGKIQCNIKGGKLAILFDIRRSV